MRIGTLLLCIILLNACINEHTPVPTEDPAPEFITTVFIPTDGNTSNTISLEYQDYGYCFIISGTYIPTVLNEEQDAFFVVDPAGIRGSSHAAFEINGSHPSGVPFGYSPTHTYGILERGGDYTFSLGRHLDQNNNSQLRVDIYRYKDWIYFSDHDCIFGNFEKLR